MVDEEERERLAATKALWTADPEAAFRIYRDAADAGVVWAMELVANQYAWGTLVAHDFEQSQAYFRRAIEAGSQMASWNYAWLLARHGQPGAGERLLQDGVEADFLPAFYWLAQFRFTRSQDRQTCRAIRPLLERAVEAGHPSATLLLAQLKLRGKFGLREIPSGFRTIWQIAGQADAADAPPGSSPSPAAA